MRSERRRSGRVPGRLAWPHLIRRWGRPAPHGCKHDRPLGWRADVDGVPSADTCRHDLSIETGSYLRGITQQTGSGRTLIGRTLIVPEPKT